MVLLDFRISIVSTIFGYWAGFLFVKKEARKFSALDILTETAIRIFEFSRTL